MEMLGLYLKDLIILSRPNHSHIIHKQSSLQTGTQIILARALSHTHTITQIIFNTVFNLIDVVNK